MWTKHYFDIRKAWKENLTSSSSSVNKTSYGCVYEDGTTGSIGVSNKSYVDTRLLLGAINWTPDATYLTKVVDKNISYGSTDRAKVFFAIGRGTTPPHC